ncbi:putative iron export permease protein FetB [invertebrate metagenome]|uniref:Putative iron export permease protein FetB n=1 Tax=invertebrate metagenome TaxID=1711999 RepID=A0A2H9T4L6_9ZZZZ
MNTNNTLSLIQLLPLYGLLIIPVLLLCWLQLFHLLQDLLISVLRMTLQLGFIGLYLQFLFRYNNWLLNLAWLSIMITVANLHILKRSGLSRYKLLWITQISLFSSVGFVLLITLLLIQPEHWHDAQYLVPMAGMLLGNCLSGNIMAMERFYNAISHQKDRYMDKLLLGASLGEATRPFMCDALKAAISPTIATMSTLGIVTLPGMMTGQILGGANPMTAIAYQIVIMIGIVTSMFTSATLNIVLSLKTSFDGFGLIKPDILHRSI